MKLANPLFGKAQFANSLLHGCQSRTTSVGDLKGIEHRVGTIRSGIRNFVKDSDELASIVVAVGSHGTRQSHKEESTALQREGGGRRTEKTKCEGQIDELNHGVHLLRGAPSVVTQNLSLHRRDSFGLEDDEQGMCLWAAPLRTP
jgi:hypothetical protein